MLAELRLVDANGCELVGVTEIRTGSARKLSASFLILGGKVAEKREEESLTLLGQEWDNLLRRLNETHIHHLVDLIENQDFDARQTDIAAVEQIDQAFRAWPRLHHFREQGVWFNGQLIRRP